MLDIKAVRQDPETVAAVVEALKVNPAITSGPIDLTVG